MKELSKHEIQRQDFVDTSIYELINLLNPSTELIDWNIEMVADVRDVIQYWLTERYQVVDEQVFYPFIPE